MESNETGITLYTWINGKFYIKQPGERWEHLSKFPSLVSMDNSINNQRGIKMSNAGLGFVGQSEGWALHQIWCKSDFYKLVKIDVELGD